MGRAASIGTQKLTVMRYTTDEIILFQMQIILNASINILKLNVMRIIDTNDEIISFQMQIILNASINILKLTVMRIIDTNDEIV